MLSPGFVLSGAGVGLLVGMTGVGGGSLMTPMLILAYGLPVNTAIATDLLFAAATNVAATSIHGAQGSVQWRITLLLAAGSVPATLATLALLHGHAPQSGEAQRLMAVTLGAALILTAIAILLRPHLVAWAASRHAPPMMRARAAATVMTGAVIGVIVTLCSVGAGAIGVTALLLLYPGTRTVRIIASDIAHTVPLTLLAGAGRWYLGGTDFGLAASLLAGSLPAVLIGGLLAHRLPDRVVRLVLALVLLATGARLLA